MARKSNSKGIGSQTQGSLSTITFSTKKGLPDYLGSREYQGVDVADKSGYNFQNILTLFSYDCCISNDLVDKEIANFMRRIKTECKFTIKFDETHLKSYFTFLNILIQQTAVLGRYLSLYNAENREIEGFPDPLFSFCGGISNEITLLRNPGVAHGYAWNSEAEFVFKLHYEELERIYKNLVNMIRSFHCPIPYLKKVWDTIRYFYDDSQETDHAFFAFLPPLYGTVLPTDTAVIAQVTEGWGSMDSASFIAMFSMLEDSAKKRVPTIYGDIDKAMSFMEIPHLDISDDLSEWSKYDEKLLVAIHNAKIGGYHSYDKHEAGTDLIDLVNDPNFDYIDKSAADVMNVDPKARNVIDSSNLDGIANEDYLRFACCWYQADRENFKPLECITSLNVFYYDDKVAVRDNISNMVSFGYESATLSPANLSLELDSLKGLMMRISLISQLKFAPPVFYFLSATDGAAYQIGWGTWIWRSGKTTHVDEEQFKNYWKEIYDQIVQR